jgi:hypothetical protein
MPMMTTTIKSSMSVKPFLALIIRFSLRVGEPEVNAESGAGFFSVGKTVVFHPRFSIPRTALITLEKR